MLVAAALAAACATGGSATPQPREGRSGLQLSGTVDGRQLAVSDGAAELEVGDCDPQDGVDEDVCVIANDIEGELVVLVFENPDALESAAILDVDNPACPPDECDDVADAAVVELQVGVAPRVRATGGSLSLRQVEPFLYYSGEIRLELPDGSVSGDFDVVPLPDD